MDDGHGVSGGAEIDADAWKRLIRHQVGDLSLDGDLRHSRRGQQERDEDVKESCFHGEGVGKRMISMVFSRHLRFQKVTRSG